LDVCEEIAILGLTVAMNNLPRVHALARQMASGVLLKKLLPVV